MERALTIWLNLAGCNDDTDWDHRVSRPTGSRSWRVQEDGDWDFSVWRRCRSPGASGRWPAGRPAVTPTVRSPGTIAADAVTVARVTSGTSTPGSTIRPTRAIRVTGAETTTASRAESVDRCSP